MKHASNFAQAESTGERMSYREAYAPLLESIAAAAEPLAMRYFRTDEMRVDRKSDGSAVTQADRGIEQMARARVAASGIPMDVLGEEMGGTGCPSTAARPRLIIDPIDGTEEFSRGIPTFGTLLGIEQNGEIVAAYIAAPGLHSRWWAYRGEGAYRDGLRLHVSDVATLSESMVFTTGTGPSKNDIARASIRRLADAARNSRAFGGFWQHMLVAEGCVEAALDWTSKPWDLAPLALIVEEAGGRSTTAQGRRSIYDGSLLSTNGKIHDEALALLQQ
jgi:histidinol-phosphatase